MSKTEQGIFDYTYHSIEAPTIQDDEWGREHRARKLVDVSSVPRGRRSGLYREAHLEYLAENIWHFKRKLDGENIRILWDGNQAVWNGRSNNYVAVPGLSEYMNKVFCEERFEEKFGRSKRVYLFGEHMGAKVQGNELMLSVAHELILFDVMVDGEWMPAENIIDVASFFGIRSCYDFTGPQLLNKTLTTLNDLIAMVSNGVFCRWEGIVAIPETPLCDRFGQRVIVKIKNRDYYTPLIKAGVISSFERGDDEE